MSQNETEKRPHHPRAPPPFPPPSCPRCSSGNTKFCYYNNYSVSQPRYICKNCRRYWTHGGVVRNIPISRKRSRAESMSSSSLPMTKPPPTGILVPQPTLAWSMGFPHNPVGGAGVGSSVGCVTFGGGGFFNQTSFGFSQGSVNTAFGGVNVGFDGGARPPPAPSTPVFSHHSGLGGFGDFGSSFIHRPQFQPPPTITNHVALNNLGNTFTSLTNLLPVARDPNAIANVVSIKEWSELDDMDSEGDPLQTYKPSLP